MHLKRLCFVEHGLFFNYNSFEKYVNSIKTISELNHLLTLFKSSENHKAPMLKEKHLQIIAKKYNSIYKAYTKQQLTWDKQNSLQKTFFNLLNLLTNDWTDTKATNKLIKFLIKNDAKEIIIKQPIPPVINFSNLILKNIRFPESLILSYINFSNSNLRNVVFENHQTNINEIINHSKGFKNITFFGHNGKTNFK